MVVWDLLRRILIDKINRNKDKKIDKKVYSWLIKNFKLR